MKFYCFTEQEVKAVEADPNVFIRALYFRSPSDALALLKKNGLNLSDLVVCWPDLYFTSTDEQWALSVVASKCLEFLSKHHRDITFYIPTTDANPSIALGQVIDYCQKTNTSLCPCCHSCSHRTTRPCPMGGDIQRSCLNPKCWCIKVDMVRLLEIFKPSETVNFSNIRAPSIVTGEVPLPQLTEFTPDIITEWEKKGVAPVIIVPDTRSLFSCWINQKYMVSSEAPPGGLPDPFLEQVQLICQWFKDNCYCGNYFDKMVPLAYSVKKTPLGKGDLLSEASLKRFMKNCGGTEFKQGSWLVNGRVYGGSLQLAASAVFKEMVEGYHIEFVWCGWGDRINGVTCSEGPTIFGWKQYSQFGFSVLAPSRIMALRALVALRDENPAPEPLPLGWMRRTVVKDTSVVWSGKTGSYFVRLDFPEQEPSLLTSTDDCGSVVYCSDVRTTLKNLLATGVAFKSSVKILDIFETFPSPLHWFGSSATKLASKGASDQMVCLEMAIYIQKMSSFPRIEVPAETVGHLVLSRSWTQTFISPQKLKARSDTATSEVASQRQPGNESQSRFPVSANTASSSSST